MFQKFELTSRGALFIQPKVFIILKWRQLVWKFPGKVSKNSEKFSKSEPLEGKFLPRNFRKFRYTSLARLAPSENYGNTGPFINENFQKFTADSFFYQMNSVWGYPLSVNSENAVSFAAGNLRNSSNSVIFGRMGSSLFRHMVCMCMYNIYVGACHHYFIIRY